MRNYTFLFVKPAEHVPSLELAAFATDQESVARAPDLARWRTNCVAVEVWDGERLVDRLVCPEPRTWAPPLVSERGSCGGWKM